jgi:hypothetical protein
MVLNFQRKKVGREEKSYDTSNTKLFRSLGLEATRDPALGAHREALVGPEVQFWVCLPWYRGREPRNGVFTWDGNMHWH